MDKAAQSQFTEGPESRWADFLTDVFLYLWTFHSPASQIPPRNSPGPQGQGLWQITLPLGML